MMNTKIKPQAVANARDQQIDDIRGLYMESLHLVERLHRRLLDVIKDEFDRQGRDDVNAVQALLLFNIGNSELTAGELRSRGFYLGSNVSYNVKKLVDLGFINHQRSRIDRRSVRISLTETGQDIAETVAKLYERHRGGGSPAPPGSPVPYRAEITVMSPICNKPLPSTSLKIE